MSLRKGNAKAPHRICAGRCGRPIRGKEYQFEANPGTVVVERQGMCRWDWDNRNNPDAVPPGLKTDDRHSAGQLIPCKGRCGRLTRHCRVPHAQAPESVTRVRDGKCQWCLDHPDGAALPPTPGRPRKVAAPRTVDEQAVEKTRRELEAFTAARRARNEARQRGAIHQQLRAQRGMTVRTA